MATESSRNSPTIASNLQRGAQAQAGFIQGFELEGLLIELETGFPQLVIEFRDSEASIPQLAFEVC